MNEGLAPDDPKRMSEEKLLNLISTIEVGPNLPYLRKYWANTSDPDTRKGVLSELQNFDFGALQSAAAVSS
jgi:hypothetical protein